jgi:hypothetical protein
VEESPMINLPESATEQTFVRVVLELNFLSLSLTAGRGVAVQKKFNFHAHRPHFLSIPFASTLFSRNARECGDVYQSHHVIKIGHETGSSPH